VKIEDLRRIGAELLSMMSDRRLKEGADTVLGTGAGGDKTYRIDRDAEDIIIRGIERLGEPVTFISEEKGIQESGGETIQVIVDPVDGSRNAVSGLPVFCSSIAVARGGTVGDVFMSYVINLANGDEFWALKGEGAYFRGERIRCQEDDGYRVILYETQTPSRDIPKILPVLSLFNRTRCLGATALDLCYLALGSVTACVIPSPSRSFDFAGGWLIAKEAGALITDTTGGSVEGTELGLGRSSPLLASAHKDIHERLLAHLS